MSQPIAAAYWRIWDASRGPQAGVRSRIGRGYPPPPPMVRHSLPFVIIVAIKLIVGVIRIRVVVKVV